MSTQPDSSSRLPASRGETPGAVILSGAHGALAVARSLGRQGIPVVLVSIDHPLPKLSRYVQRRFAWPGPEASDAVPWLMDLAATEHLQDWVLVPCADADVRLVAENRTRLRSAFRVMSSGWEALQDVCDKASLARRAAQVGIAAPRSYDIRNAADAAAIDAVFPVVLKPSQRDRRNAFTLAKAWRADTPAEFQRLYQQAADLMEGSPIVVQELIPGGGETQLSYAAVWKNGAPVASLTARRTRQYPLEFSYTSTFVESCDCPEATAAAERLLAAIGFEGLVEVEFKYDARDRQYKVLDVNPRPWSWIALGAAAGLDFPLTFYRAAYDMPVAARALKPAAWMHLARDGVAALQLMARGDLALVDYARSFRPPLVWASMALDDPLPGLAEIPLTLYRAATRRLPFRIRRPEPHPAH